MMTDNHENLFTKWMLKHEWVAWWTSCIIYQGFAKDGVRKRRNKNGKKTTTTEIPRHTGTIRTWRNPVCGKRWGRVFVLGTSTVP